jgi:hypothetical protein
VEFALVAPLLLLLAFGIVDFGRAMYYQNEITNAAREGARIAILASNPCNTVYGNPGGSCGTSSSPAGPTVCGAIDGSASLITHWSCGEGSLLLPGVSGDGTTQTSQPGWAYVEVDQSSSPSSCPTVGSNPVTPRSSGNLMILVTIHYYFRPLTPIVSSFFPSSFYLSSSVCARDEY